MQEWEEREECESPRKQETQAKTCLYIYFPYVNWTCCPQTSDNHLPQQLSLLLSGCHGTSLPDNHLSYHLRPAVSHIRWQLNLHTPSNQPFSSCIHPCMSTQVVADIKKGRHLLVKSWHYRCNVRHALPNKFLNHKTHTKLKLKCIIFVISVKTGEMLPVK